MRIEARYADKATARLGLRRWRGLYGDPEADPEDRWFRVRFLPPDLVRDGPNVEEAETEQYPYAVVSFTDREEADAVDADGEIKEASK